MEDRDLLEKILANQNKMQADLKVMQSELFNVSFRVAVLTPLPDKVDRLTESVDILTDRADSVEDSVSRLAGTVIQLTHVVMGLDARVTKLESKNGHWRDKEQE